MGGGFSGLKGSDHDGEDGGAAGLGDLPENCIALILSHLDHPDEICKFASLTKAFHRASLSDLVWESKLPENHRLLVHKLQLLDDDGDHCSLTMKQIYAKLCCPSRFSGNTMEVWLDKSKGGICVAISWKGLTITGIDDRRYWTTNISTHQSRFNTIAYLHQIWWLEVEGQLGFEFPKGTYSLFFRLKLGRATKTAATGCRRRPPTEKVHGWEIKPVQFQLSSSSSNGQCVITSQGFLQDQGTWIYHHVGDFDVEDSWVPTKLKFSMTQIDCTHTKGGLCLDSVLILPSMQ